MQILWMGSKKLKFLITFLLFASLFVNFSLSATSEVLKGMPESAKKQLEELFKYFIYKTTISYTLFGDKPVSWDVMLLPTFPQIKGWKKIIYRDLEFRFPLWSQWKVWKYYEKSFPIKNFLIIEEISESLRRDIFIINKEKFIEIVNLNQDLFQKTGENLLIEIENTSSLRGAIQNDDLLLGILLGFGRHNSKLFQERKSLNILYDRYKNLLMKDSSTLQILRNKTEKITNILQLFGENYLFPTIIGNVQFVADLNHPETKILENKYKQQKRKITSIYSKGNILEITMHELMK